MKSRLQQMMEKGMGVKQSPLFCWIAILIVFPLLLIMAIICTMVATTTGDTLPRLLYEMKNFSIELERDKALSISQARAAFVAEVLVEPVRDLHIYSRIAGWLISDAWTRSDSFTSQNQFAEECKYTPKNETCPLVLDDTRFACDCKWKDPRGLPCRSYDSDTRYLQRRFFAGEKSDTDPLTGNRNSTSYPDVAFSPQTTSWWDNVDEMPGSWKGANASGYRTTYDRVRVSSAFSIIEFPLYNYDGMGRRKKHLGMYVAFEADGLFVGYIGCGYALGLSSYASIVSSSLSNGASTDRVNICPPGKYGYDPRCRGWYELGKAADKMYVTPPYRYAVTEIVACTITAPLHDQDGMYIGQSHIGFIPQALLVGALSRGFRVEFVCLLRLA
jgi:hypothetical protein